MTPASNGMLRGAAMNRGMTGCPGNGKSGGAMFVTLVSPGLTMPAKVGISPGLTVPTKVGI
jgi:hypothetical protein